MVVITGMKSSEGPENSKAFPEHFFHLKPLLDLITVFLTGNYKLHGFLNNFSVFIFYFDKFKCLNI